MAGPMRPEDRVVSILAGDAALRARLRTDSDPMPAIREAADKAKDQAAWFQDQVLFRIAVIVLGALALIAALGSIVLVALGKTTPEALVALGSAAVGALVGLFAPSPSGK